MSTDQLTQRISVLEEQVQKLQQAQADQIQPNILQVLAGGIVVPVFPGGAHIPEAPIGTPLSSGLTDAIVWTPAVDASGAFEVILGAALAAGKHGLTLGSVADAKNIALLETLAQEGGAAGSASAFVTVSDTTLGSASQTILDSIGRSGYLQGGAYSAAGVLGAPPISQPARALNTAYTPNTTRPTLVLMTLAMTPNSFVALLLNGVTNIAQLSNGANPAQVSIPLLFFVPAGASYEALVTLGAPSLSATTEITL